MSSILKVDTIQDQSGNNIINENADTITIGASGDTIVIPSGATLTGTGAGLVWQSVQTTGFTAVKGNAYPCDTTLTAFTVTLPATPSAGDQVQLVDYAGTFDTNALTIAGNGEDIEGLPADYQLTGEREGVILTYIDSTQGWIATSGINEGTSALAEIFTADFLVIAGGGSGGNAAGGGGGAGGYRELTSQNLLKGTNYTVTVGAGAATQATSGQAGNKGSNSVFNTITSNGGGGGAGFSDRASADIDGGSGGGSAGENVGAGAGGIGNTPSTAPSQGNNGGSGDSSNFVSGGGGGSGGVGVNGINPNSGNGGAGTASSITGSSVTRAGGGGGGGNLSLSKTGGTGQNGGGNGGAGNDGTAATVNTGSGGGGGSGAASFNGGAGGSGIVIIKYPDTFTISNPGGGLTSSTATAGGFSVTTFTAGTGNVQFN